MFFIFFFHFSEEKVSSFLFSCISFKYFLLLAWRDSWDWVGPPAWERACFNSPEWGGGSSPVKTEPPQIVLLLLLLSLLFVVVRWFVGSLVRWFVGSLVRWFVGSLVRWFVGSLVRWFVRSFVRSFVRKSSFRAAQV